MKPTHQRFIEHVQENENGCWIWLSTKNHRGYGIITIENRKIPAHRYSWSYYNNQKIPDGMYVCHTCDNPSCVNPNHLFLGTQKDNMQDMVRKGRNSDTKGENNPRANLYDDAIIQIRKLWDVGASANEIAIHFCIPIGTVRNILNNTTWTHLPPCKRKPSNRGSHLNENDVQEIKRLYSLGKLSQEFIGKMFRLKQAQVSRIIRGESWT